MKKLVITEQRVIARARRLGLEVAVIRPAHQANRFDFKTPNGGTARCRGGARGAWEWLDDYERES